MQAYLLEGIALFCLNYSFCGNVFGMRGRSIAMATDSLGVVL